MPSPAMTTLNIGPLRQRSWTVLSLALAVLGAGPGRACAGTLEEELLKQAPTIIKHLQDKGYANVGVLKFRVQKGAGPLSDNVGLLNLNLARRLEIALVLANDVRKPINLIQDASAVAATLNGANHLTKEGRQKLFVGRYALAWDARPVEADAFLTGVASIRSDLKEMTVGILVFDRSGDELMRVTRFPAAMDPVVLVEAGESFLLRGAFDKGQVELKPDQAITTAARVREKGIPFPINDQLAPIALEIRYDGKRVKVEVSDGQARIPEPQQGQKVTFTLRRQARDKVNYGVVLKVNGENTLYRQRLKDVDCRKWILGPGDTPITLEGFQVDAKTAGKFRVRSPAESKAREMSYGIDVGMITLVVFRESAGRADPLPPLTDEEEDLTALTRGVFPTERPKNLAALRQQLRSEAVKSRGLIAEGEKIGSVVTRVKFQADPTPVMTATISYYRP